MFVYSINKMGRMSDLMIEIHNLYLEIEKCKYELDENERQILLGHINDIDKLQDILIYMKNVLNPFKNN